MITGAAFVDLSAAYDTVNHRILIQKLYNITPDSHLCRVLQNILSNLSPILFNIYTNDQPLHDRTRSFIHAVDICVTAQYSSCIEVERTIGDALDKLTQYYRSNSLCANPDKTQVTAFHMNNKEAKRSSTVVCNKT